MSQTAVAQMTVGAGMMTPNPNSQVHVSNNFMFMMLLRTPAKLICRCFGLGRASFCIFFLEVEAEAAPST